MRRNFVRIAFCDLLIYNSSLFMRLRSFVRIAGVWGMTKLELIMIDACMGLLLAL